MLKLLFITMIGLAASPMLWGQQRPSSLMQKRVTFSLPGHWEIQNDENWANVSKIQILIPYPQADGTPHSANVAIVAKTVPAKVTLKEVGDQVYKKKYPGMAIIEDIPDGEEWRTIVWAANNGGVPYLMLNRFGCANGIEVEVLVAFPLFEKGDKKWVEKTVSDFNALCETLKIDGKNSDEVDVNLDKLSDVVKPAPVPPKTPPVMKRQGRP